MSPYGFVSLQISAAVASAVGVMTNTLTAKLEGLERRLDGLQGVAPPKTPEKIIEL